MDLNESYDLFEESLAHKDEWLAFLKSMCDDKETFLRRVGFPQTAIIAKNINVIYNRICDIGLPRRAPCFMTIYEFRGYNKNTLNSRRKKPDTRTALRNKLYFDFDCIRGDYSLADIKSKLALAYEDAKTVHNYFGGYGRLYYTGGRGFALYVDLVKELKWPQIPEHLKRGYFILRDVFGEAKAPPFECTYELKPNKLNQYLWKSHKNLIEFVCTSEREQIQLTRYIMSIPTQVSRKIDRLNLKTLDYGIKGVPCGGQQHRIPYTTHQTTGRFCIPIEPTWSLERIISESEKLQIPKPIIRRPISFKDNIVSPKNIILNA